MIGTVGIAASARRAGALIRLGSTCLRRPSCQASKMASATSRPAVSEGWFRRLLAESEHSRAGGRSYDYQADGCDEPGYRRRYQGRRAASCGDGALAATAGVVSRAPPPEPPAPGSAATARPRSAP